MPPRPRLRLAPLLVLTGLVALAPATSARAYLIETNDARVADHGSFELELAPIGYYQLVVGDEYRELIAPSMQLYLGIAPGWDLLYLTRGYGRIEGDPTQSAYSLSDQMVAFRTMLVRGRYSDEGHEGPSLTLQTGVLLPGVDAETGFGATIALLFAQQWDAGTLHLNAWVNLTHERLLNLFFTSCIEGPDAWTVRPVVEVWIDLVVDGDPTLSGLLGAVWDVSDDVALQGGVRMGGWEGWLDFEVRLSAYFAVPLWNPSPGASDEDEDDEHERAGEGEAGDASVAWPALARGPGSLLAW